VSTRIAIVIVALMVAGFVVGAAVIWMFDDVRNVIAKLDDDSPSIRAAAAKRLGKIGNHRSYDPLIRALHDDDPRVRVAAAEALADLGDPRAVRAVARRYRVEVDGPYSNRYERALRRLLDIRNARR